MKLIQLGHDKFAKVDDEWYDYLMQWKWRCNKAGYATRRSNGKTVFMHREVNWTPEGVQTDHKDRDKLNNQADNLRDATAQENVINRVRHSKWGYRGVRLKPCGGKRKGSRWQAYIRLEGRQTHLGYYPTKEAAARAYDEAARATGLYLESVLNFPTTQ